MKLFFVWIRLSIQGDHMQPLTITFIAIYHLSSQSIAECGKGCLMSSLLCASASNAENGKKNSLMVACLHRLLDNLYHASASIAKKMEKKILMRACLHHILCQKLSVRDAVYVETNLESNSGNPAPPF